jgi:hypothetical protein
MALGSDSYKMFLKSSILNPASLIIPAIAKALVGFALEFRIANLA